MKIYARFLRLNLSLGDKFSLNLKFCGETPENTPIQTGLH